MRVLVACERSGVVRDAFLDAGHEAYSCDLLPSDTLGPHYQGNVLDIIEDGWDLMIAHPPCDHLAWAGAAFMRQKRQDGRQKAALLFVRQLMAAPIARVCIENPVSVISQLIRKPDQTIQPWQYGHTEQKTTCLWLTNLPLLVPTQVMDPPRYVTGKAGQLVPRWDNQYDSGRPNLPHSYDRAYKRAITYEGIAEAMATQWGPL